MPAPDPEGLWIVKTDTGYRGYYYAYLWSGRDQNRKRGMEKMLRRLAAGTWPVGGVTRRYPHTSVWARFFARKVVESRRLETCGFSLF